MTITFHTDTDHILTRNPAHPDPTDNSFNDKIGWILDFSFLSTVVKSQHTDKHIVQEKYQNQ